MPRIKRGPPTVEPTRHTALLADLIGELRQNRPAGQPYIEEFYFPKTEMVRATVIWDRWQPLTDEERTALILHAYEQAEGPEFRDRIALAIGITTHEAYESGLLPYQIITALRPDDPVTAEDCAQALLDQGASLLFDRKKPQLRLATEEEAEACRLRLIAALPGSERIWLVTREVGRNGDH